MSLPKLPVSLDEFIPYITKHSSIKDAALPFLNYEHELRKVYAQTPNDPALSNPLVNCIPVFSGHENDIKIHARDLKAETEEQRQRYLMPLKSSERRLAGSAAVVSSLAEFRSNFSIFSESALADLDFSNVVVAGSAVTTTLVPAGVHAASKRSLRAYYHKKVAPASDVDLFLYGLTEEQAIEKIKVIERSVRDSILQETTTVRTKNAITIVSQYPVRHVQIVLRIYSSISEILTGFDVDCSCAAYDGHQVYATPRALVAYMCQINVIDLSRRSPSYENRLSKYSRRGFEVHWPQLDRSRIDPTIFERNYSRTQGLARLLVLEKLPTDADREAYMDQRRAERGRPQINRWQRNASKMTGNLKEGAVDEVAEWVEEEEIASYHTFTIPYGPNVTASKIDRLLFQKDMLLNAEWNKQKNREVNLHRHPAFFGHVEDIIQDCCGTCPEPQTDEEKEASEDESKIFVSGPLKFMQDDPGRQAIGSFHPITTNDWTDMAYVSSNERLTRAIVAADIATVRAWFTRENVDPNQRDYTGRTPLHLAVTTSTPEIVQCLIDNGARLVARLADGRTALHLAATRGDVDMVRSILRKSEANEHEQAEKDTIKAAAKRVRRQSLSIDGTVASNAIGVEIDNINEFDGDSEAGMETATEASFVNVTSKHNESSTDLNEDDDDEPDIFDVNVVAWDTPVSALHLAVIMGHIEVLKELVQTFGADVLLPVKFFNGHDKSPRSAILTLVLALNLPAERAVKMSQTLLAMGASAAQADFNHVTAFHRFVDSDSSTATQALIAHDVAAVKRVINFPYIGGWYSYTADTPLTTSIKRRNAEMATILLAAGATATIEFDDYLKRLRLKEDTRQDTLGPTRSKFNENVDQPVIRAIRNEMVSIAARLVDLGADINTVTAESKRQMNGQQKAIEAYSLLDIVERKIASLQPDLVDENDPQPPKALKEDEFYFGTLQRNSYKFWKGRYDLDAAKEAYKTAERSFEEKQEEISSLHQAREQKKMAITRMKSEMATFKKSIVAKGAKSVYELFDNFDKSPEQRQESRRKDSTSFKLEFTFQSPEITDGQQVGYEQIFEAAWHGDFEIIKSLTFEFWGPGKANPPLPIAVRDNDGHSPFSIALIRGHIQLARSILQIVRAQHRAEEEPEQKIYNIRLAGQDDDGDDRNFEDDSDAISLTSQIVDQKFTIENIGDITKQSKSLHSALEVLSWQVPIQKLLREDESLPGGLVSLPHKGGQVMHYWQGNYNYPGEHKTLLDYAILSNNTELFSCLVDLKAEHSIKTSNVTDLDRTPLVPQETFELAIQHSRLDIISIAISRSAGGASIQSLVKESGIKVIEKAKYYQGLSVRGKKRTDWLRNTQATLVRSTTAPVLVAALKGRLDAVEWFLSNTPLRLYTEFARNNEEQKQMQILQKKSGGPQRAFAEWLSSRNDLLIHCAVLAKASDTTTQLLKFLIDMFPDLLNTKSREGHTPLQLAFGLRQTGKARILIEAGADQTCRDKTGRNILHTLFGAFDNHNQTLWDAKLARGMLRLVDPRLLQSLLVERCFDEKRSSLTPLAYWLSSHSMVHRYNGHTRFGEPTGMSTERADVLQILLQFSNGADLDCIDGAGDSPLHIMVKSYMLPYVQVIIEHKPELLWRENATGRTPWEMVQDAWLSVRLGEQPSIGTDTVRTYNWQDIGWTVMDQPVREFTAEAAEEDKGSPVDQLYNMCSLVMQDEKNARMKRRLVTLWEANEVAERLAARERTNREVEDNETADMWRRARGMKTEMPDEIDEWFYEAIQDKVDEGDDEDDDNDSKSN